VLFAGKTLVLIKCGRCGASPTFTGVGLTVAPKWCILGWRLPGRCGSGWGEVLSSTLARRQPGMVPRPGLTATGHGRGTLAYAAVRLRRRRSQAFKSWFVASRCRGVIGHGQESRPAHAAPGDNHGARGGEIYPSAFIFLNSSISTGTTLKRSPTMP